MNISKNIQDMVLGNGLRYQGYDRIMGNISWLLIALVSLDIKLLPPDESSTMYLSILCLLMLAYNITARYGPSARAHGQFKTFVDLMLFMAFIVAVSWFTGKITSPFISLIYLILMATSLTQGRRVTYFMVVLAISSYILLASEDLFAFLNRHTLLSYVLELFPFMLIAHLGAMLSGETEHARREIERLSLTDELTGLNNMRNFFYLSEFQEKLATRHGRNFAICMLDADNLKQVNDRHGHLAGTELIKHVARVIEDTTRGTDIAARYGGDEFVILFTESSKREVEGAVQRIVDTMRSTPFQFHNAMLSTSLSAGIASFPEDGDTVRSVMANADLAMYRSKRQGKNRISIYDPALDMGVVSESIPTPPPGKQPRLQPAGAPDTV